MTIDQTLQLVSTLIHAALDAIKTGEPNVDLLSALQYTDDEARANLEQAIEIAKEVVDQ